MNHIISNFSRLSKCMPVFAGILSIFVMPAMTSPVQAQERVPLMITGQPVPESLKNKIYNKPVQTREVRPQQLIGKTYYSSGQETVVGQKASQLSSSLGNIQKNVESLSSQLNAVQSQNESRAAQYYAAIATINTQLQTGTTPGNPRLVKRLGVADATLENLAANVSRLNQLAVEIAQVASEASFLLEETRAAYNISGAIEEDHVQLALLEDSIHSTLVLIERLLNNVNDDITRTSAYLNSERNNLRTLSLAVSKGDLYGKSLSNRPFSGASMYQAGAQDTPSATSSGNLSANASTINYDDFNDGDDYAEPSYEATVQKPVLSRAPVNPRPLAKIKFDRADVNYEQPIYMAMNDALDRYPDAQFDLVAVHPTSGNAAEVAIESTRARRNAERVLRTLTQMGLPLDRIELSYDVSAQVTSNEVHLYIR